MLDAGILVDRVKAYHPNADTALIAKAYEYANRAHEGQKRKSGEPYFTHPVSVAGILTDLRLDTASVCAGLLHDVVEGPHVVEAVAELDQEHADVARHGHDHLAEVLGLAVGLRDELDLGELGDPIDQLG
ncbi:MAG: bifunctional (p)ppGpp synthetase/guanosine-3',5'-bis(diphosphate) 3'-pyrophosphohydrolase, partial [Myxococcales bacterium]